MMGRGTNTLPSIRMGGQYGTREQLLKGATEQPSEALVQAMMARMKQTPDLGSFGAGSREEGYPPFQDPMAVKMLLAKAQSGQTLTDAERFVLEQIAFSKYSMAAGPAAGAVAGSVVPGVGTGLGAWLGLMPFGYMNEQSNANAKNLAYATGQHENLGGKLYKRPTR